MYGKYYWLQQDCCTSTMGGSVSCCFSTGESPKIYRREVELEECPITTTEDVSEDTGTYLQHISDRELPDGVFFFFFLLNHVQKLTCSRLHISNLIHTCILQNWPKKPTLQTIPELALSSSTSHRQTVFKIISLKYTFFPPFKSHNLTLLFFFFHKFSA